MSSINSKRNHAFKDITGMKFGRLTALNYFFEGKVTYWNCVCECGNKKAVRATHLMSGRIRSCGCIRKEGPHKTHNMHDTRFYRIWQGMKSRTKGAKGYADRGIFLCERWETFENFKDDMYKKIFETRFKIRK